MFATDFACHCPPRAVEMPRALSASAISLRVRAVSLLCLADDREHVRRVPVPFRLHGIHGALAGHVEPGANSGYAGTQPCKPRQRPRPRPVPNFPRLRALALFGCRHAELAVCLSLLPVSKKQHMACPAGRSAPPCRLESLRLRKRGSEADSDVQTVAGESRSITVPLEEQHNYREPDLSPCSWLESMRSD
jgi:hypothetical protein